VFWTGLVNTGGQSGSSRNAAKGTLTFPEFPSLDARPSLDLSGMTFDVRADEPCMQVNRVCQDDLMQSSKSLG